MIKPYKRMDTTADVGLIGSGETIEELFSNMAKGLFSLITDLSHIRKRRHLNVKIAASDIEGLLVNWLNELIFIHEVDKVLLHSFTIKHINNQTLEAVCFGEAIDQKRHLLKMQIKAATYHRLSIWKDNNIWQARVILDV